MSLYPTTMLDPITAATGANIVPSGSLVAIPLDMSLAQMVQIIVAQVSATEDFGLRGWISLYPDGISLLAMQPMSVFALSRMTPRPVVLYIQGQTPSIDTIVALVTPGLYYLNILNLTNAQSMFAFVMSTLA